MSQGLEDRAGLIVSERWRCVYCIVPKAACSNWIMLLRRIEGFEDYAEQSPLHDREASGLTYMMHEEANAGLDLDRYFKFTFVRDPFSRLLSAWRNKFDPSAGQVHEIWLEYAEQVRGRLESPDDAEQGPLSFGDFVRYLDVQPVEEIPLHWAPQTHILALDRFEYDFVGRIENVGEDFEVVRERVGFEARFPTRDDLWFHPPTGADTLISRMYTLELVDIVTRVFADDFEAFGYPGAPCGDSGPRRRLSTPGNRVVSIPTKEHSDV